MTNVFEHLFGWNYKKRESSVHGGILGHLSAFYGTSEFTEHGNLHGHFLIWLVWGLNPADIHTKLKQDKIFEKYLFSFFEDIIQHLVFKGVRNGARTTLAMPGMRSCQLAPSLAE